MPNLFPEYFFEIRRLPNAVLYFVTENDGVTTIFSVFSEDGAKFLANEPADTKIILAIGVFFLALGESMCDYVAL